MYECPYCKEFRSMNKKALEQHIQEKHRGKVKEQKKGSSKGKEHVDYIAVLKDNYRKVKVKMLTGEEFTGQITDFTTFMFILKTEEGLKYIFKHGVAYIDPA